MKTKIKDKRFWPEDQQLTVYKMKEFLKVG